MDVFADADTDADADRSISYMTLFPFQQYTESIQIIIMIFGNIWPLNTLVQFICYFINMIMWGVR